MCADEKFIGVIDEQTDEIPQSESKADADEKPGQKQVGFGTGVNIRGFKIPS